MPRNLSLSRNLFYNLSGAVLPVAVAAVCIPVLIHTIGTDRFGLLTIAWTIIGYFSLFDFGLGRSLTWQVSRRLGEGRQGEIAAIVRSALILMTLLSLIGTLVVAVFSGELIRLLRVPQALIGETRTTLFLLSASIPLVVLTSGLRGVLEAFQRFDVTNAIRVVQGVWTFVGPLCVLPFTVHLQVLVTVLVIGRLVTTIAYGVAALGVLPPADHTKRVPTLRQREIFAYGGWTTLSNILSPVMDYMDRFFISSILGAAIVAFYTTPYEVVYRLNFISEGILGVLFPLMAKRMAHTRSDGTDMLSLGTKLITALLFPATLIILLAAHPGLRLWLGPEFERKSALVLQLLAVGLLINSLAKVPSNLLQANGRSDVTAILHIVEVPIYVVCLLWALSHLGIAGAALVWTLRMLLDLALLLWMTRTMVAVPLKTLRTVGALAVAQILALCGAIVVVAPGWSVLYGAAVLLVFAAGFYRIVLLDSERTVLREYSRRILAYLTRKPSPG